MRANATPRQPIATRGPRGAFPTTPPRTALRGLATRAWWTTREGSSPRRKTSPGPAWAPGVICDVIAMARAPSGGRRRTLTEVRKRAAIAATIAGLFACEPPPRPIPLPQSTAPQAPAASPIGVPSPEATASRMAHVPEGTLRIGSEFGKGDERPVHAVHISAFDMDVTEVTVAQYGAC